MDCRRALEALHDDLDGRLDASARTGLAAHVAVCPACARASHQLAALRKTFRAVPSAPAPSDLHATVMARVRATPLGDAAPARGRLLSWPRLAFPVAAAAALLVGAFVIAQRAREDIVARAPASGLANGFREEAPGAAASKKRLGTASGPLEAKAEGGTDAATPATEAEDKAEFAGAPEPAKGGDVGARGARAPAAPVPPSPAEPTAPPAAAPTPRVLEKGAGADSREAAKRTPPRTRVVVFRSDAEAAKFVVALAALESERRAGESEKRDEGAGVGGLPKEGDGGKSVPGSSAVGGAKDSSRRGAPTKRAPEPAPAGPQVPGAGGGGAPSEAPGPAPRIAARTEIRGDAWLALATSANARVVEVRGDEIASLDRGDAAEFVAIREALRRLLATPRDPSAGTKPGAAPPVGEPSAPLADAPQGESARKKDRKTAADAETAESDLDDEGAETLLVVVLPAAPTER